jgi:hypothetical protein
MKRIENERFGKKSKTDGKNRFWTNMKIHEIFLGIRHNLCPQSSRRKPVILNDEDLGHFSFISLSKSSMNSRALNWKITWAVTKSKNRREKLESDGLWFGNLITENRAIKKWNLFIIYKLVLLQVYVIICLLLKAATFFFTFFNDLCDLRVLFVGIWERGLIMADNWVLRLERGQETVGIGLSRGSFWMRDTWKKGILKRGGKI